MCPVSGLTGCDSAVQRGRPLTQPQLPEISRQHPQERRAGGSGLTHTASRPASAMTNTGDVLTRMTPELRAFTLSRHRAMR
jgi:hypothetical protein